MPLFAPRLRNVCGDRTSYVSQESCAQRTRLSDIVVLAGETVDSAKTAWEGAVRTRSDLEACDVVLKESRRLERQAVAALEGHREKHGC
jgi:hypothetical protein